MPIEQKPFSGTCPMCQYTDRQVAKQVSNAMNKYKHTDGRETVMNSSEQEIETDTGKWVLQPNDGSQNLTLISPKTLAAIKALAEVSTGVASLEGQAGNPATGLAKGASIVGNPGATASMLNK